MRSDALISFVPLNAPLSLVAGAGATIPSNIIDLIGSGVGTNPTASGGNIIGQTSTGGVPLFGEDMGVGGGNRPELMIAIGTALAGAVGQQLKVALQGAPDTVTFQPGTWQDIDSQDGITLAQGVAGAVIFRSPFIPTMPNNLRPRYLRLLFSPMTSTTLPSGSFTAGTIAFALVTWVRDDQANKFQYKNYTVA